jgi:hypothetical protein
VGAVRRRRGHGKLIGLLRLLKEHGGAIEADFARFYPGHDMLDLFRGRLTWRRFANLVRWLPPESALVRSRLGPDASWGLAEQLLAIVIDQLSTANWQRGHGKEHERPHPFPRPGLESPTAPPKRSTLTTDEMATRLVEQRRRHASRN